MEAGRPDPDTQPQQLPSEPTFDHDDEDENRGDFVRRPSTSTIGSRSRRESYYDSQRISSRRSRPLSGDSQTSYSSKSTRSKGKQRASARSSYGRSAAGDPHSGDNVTDDEFPPPVPGTPQWPRLEEGRTRQQTPDPGAGLVPATHVRNFSQPYAVRRRGSGANSRDVNLSELAALPPVPKDRRSANMDHYPPEGKDFEKQPPPDAEPGNPNNKNVQRPINNSRSPSDRLYTSRHPNEFISSQRPPPKWLTTLYTASYLIFFSIFGTLARLGLQWLTFYPGAPVTTPVIWANMAGSYIMGFLSEDQGLFWGKAHEAALSEKRQSTSDEGVVDRATLTKYKKTIPLYVGLATGFCGSFTSFSSFARDFFLGLSNNLPAPDYHIYTTTAGVVSPTQTVGRHDGYSFEAVAGVVLSTLALSLGGFVVGQHTAIMLEHHTPSIPTKLLRRVLDPSMILLGWGCWLGAIFLSIWPPDRSAANETWRGEVLFALVFAPLGCLIRWQASLRLNPLIAVFPLGTFAVNMFGTAVEGMCYDLQHVGIVGVNSLAGGGRVGCQVLQGVMDGFCGCLTTVSTWVSEIHGLKRKYGYFYALASVVCGLCLMVIIMGSVRWSVGFQEPVCNTGYPSKVHG